MKTFQSLFTLILLVPVLVCAQGDRSNRYIGPIIDMHFHFDSEAFIPTNPMGLCPPFSNMILHFDQQTNYEDVWMDNLINPKCENPFWSPKTYEDYQKDMIEEIKKHDMTVMASATIELHEHWAKKIPDRIIRGLQFRLGRESIDTDSLEQLFVNGKINVLAEITNQYHNIAPNDPRMLPYYALAERYDIPVGIHLGSGLPGVMYHWEPEYRANLSNPLVLEEILREFPKLRVYVMHYGDPFIDEMITMLYHYPQLYIDIGGIQWNYPKEYFYEYHLKKFVAAGFGKRILFGSDTILWPQLIAHSIEIIQEAPFLTLEQKADIFYNNAKRFLRLGD